MKYEEIIQENSIRPTSIDIDEENGSVSGYAIPSECEQLPNWLEKHDLYNESLIAMLREKFSVIAFLNNLNVDEESRNEGNGSYLFDLFKEQAIYNDCDAILLIADTGESNDFDLTAWYERLGCKIIAQSSGGPLMLLSL